MEYTLEIDLLPTSAIPPDWASMHPIDLAARVEAYVLWSCACSAGLDISYAIEADALHPLPKVAIYDSWRAVCFASVLVPADELPRLVAAFERMIELEGGCFPEDADQPYELGARILPALRNRQWQVAPGESFLLFLM